MISYWATPTEDAQRRGVIKNKTAKTAQGLCCPASPVRPELCQALPAPASASWACPIRLGLCWAISSGACLVRLGLSRRPACSESPALRLRPDLTRAGVEPAAFCAPARRSSAELEVHLPIRPLLLRLDHIWGLAAAPGHGALSTPPTAFELGTFSPSARCSTA